MITENNAIKRRTKTTHLKQRGSDDLVKQIMPKLTNGSLENGFEALGQITEPNVGKDSFRAVDGWRLTELRQSNPNIYRNMRLLEIPAYLSQSQDIDTLNSLYLNGTPSDYVNTNKKVEEAKHKVKSRRDKSATRKKAKSIIEVAPTQVTTFTTEMHSVAPWHSMQPEQQENTRIRAGRWISMDQLPLSALHSQKVESKENTSKRNSEFLENQTNGFKASCLPELEEEPPEEMHSYAQDIVPSTKRPQSETIISWGDSHSSIQHDSSEQGSKTQMNGSFTGGRSNGVRIPRVYSRRELRHSMHELGFGKIESYKKLELIGEGTYASVYKGYSMLLERMVALKEIRMEETEGAPCTAIREISLLRELRHANIVTLHDVIYAPNSLTLVFEYVEQDLRSYMSAHKNRLHMKTVKLFMFQIFRALAFCHERRILHRDLKPQNLLITENRELKLADFGLARAKSIPTKTYSNEVATLWYRPPDVLLGDRNYSGHIDIWGAGCIFYEMVAGRTPFPGDSKENQIFVIFRKLGIPPEGYWPGLKRNEKFQTIVLMNDVDSPCSNSIGRVSSSLSNKSMEVDNEIKEFTEHLRHVLRGRVTRLDTHGLDLLTQCLHLLGVRRITAADALKHKYFDHVLPNNLDPRDLSPEHSICANTESMSKRKNIYTAGKKYFHRPETFQKLKMLAASMDDVRIKSTTHDPEVATKAESEQRSIRNSWFDDTLDIYDESHTKSPHITRLHEEQSSILNDSTTGATNSQQSLTETKELKAKSRRVKFEVVGYELGSKPNASYVPSTPDSFKNERSLMQKYLEDEFIKPTPRRPSIQRILSNVGNVEVRPSPTVHRSLDREVCIRPNRLYELANGLSEKNQKAHSSKIINKPHTQFTQNGQTANDQVEQYRIVSIRPPLVPIHRENTAGTKVTQQNPFKIMNQNQKRLSITELSRRGAKPGGPLRVVNSSWWPTSDAASHNSQAEVQTKPVTIPIRSYRNLINVNGRDSPRIMRTLTPTITVEPRSSAPKQFILPEAVTRPASVHAIHIYNNSRPDRNKADKELYDSTNSSALLGALEMLDGACEL